MTTDFDNADYYDCDEGSEDLSYTHPQDAIERYLDGFADVGDSMGKLIAEHAPITVYAFEREEPADDWYTRVAACLAEDAFERWCDEHGGEVSEERTRKLEASLLAALREHFKPEDVWACKQVASREYGAEELRHMFKDEIAADAAEGKSS